MMYLLRWKPALNEILLRSVVILSQQGVTESFKNNINAIMRNQTC